MYQTIALSSSMIAFILGIVSAIYGAKKKENARKYVLGSLGVGVALALLPIYMQGYQGSQGGPMDVFLIAILGVVRAMTGENSVFDTREMVGILPESSIGFICLYTACIHIVATALLLGFLLSLIRDFFPKLNYRFFSKGNIYVFTDLSERSLLLAEDIYTNKEQKLRESAIIVFLSEVQDEDSSGYVERVHKIGGFLFDLGVNDLKLYFKNIEEAHFFLLKTNEVQNLEDALSLDAKYKEQQIEKKIQIHVLNSEAEAEAVVDSIEYNTNISFRLIRESRAMLYGLFDTSPLFLGARKGQLSVLVVGVGRNGMEAIKIASWCGQTAKLQPKIVAVDNDAKIKKYFENEEKVEFFTADVESKDFVEILKSHPEVGYVVCALGNEILNLRTAMLIRSVYEEVRILQSEGKELQKEPAIHVLLENQFIYDVGSKIQFDTKEKCNLIPFGSLKEMYTWDNMVRPYFDCAGQAANRFYAREYGKNSLEGLVGEDKREAVEKILKNGDKDYEDKEYNRVSSVALGVHCKYKLYTCLAELSEEKIEIDWTKKPSEEILWKAKRWLSDPDKGKERIEILAKLEHSRWNTYMKTQGWKTVSTTQADLWFKNPEEYPDLLKRTHRNFTAKLHPCLVSWEELEEVDKWMKESHGENSDFQELDRIMVENFPRILLEAGKLSEKKEWFQNLYTEIKIQEFWKNLNITENKKIALLGGTKEVSLFLKHGLLMNLYSTSQSMEYHIWDKKENRRFYPPTKKLLLDRVIFHENEWRKSEREAFGIDGIVHCEIPEVGEEEQNRLDEAKFSHEDYCEKYGGEDWEMLSDFQKASNISSVSYAGVQKKLYKTGVSIEKLAELEHVRWYRFYYLNGWKYGNKRNNEKKLHSSLVPYKKLSLKEKQKDMDKVCLVIKENQESS